MFNVKKVTMLALLLLTIGVAGAAVTYQSFADSHSVTEERIFDESITGLIVESDNSKIEISPSTDQSASVEFLYDTSRKSRYTLEATVEDGELRVKVKEKVLQFFNFDFNIKSFTTKIYLPEQTYESIMAKTENGAITIDDITAESVKAESTNGKVLFRNLNTENIIAKTENGKIKLQAVQGELQAKATNGKIELEADSIDRIINFETVNGKIVIQTDKKPVNTEIHAEVVNGSANIFGEKINHTNIGDGENKVNLRTVNGRITVE